MLWSKNLINIKDSVETYNTFVKQINDMQREENTILNKRLVSYRNITADLYNVLNELDTAYALLIQKIKIVETLIYYC